jgi:hypothetical protein
MNEQLAYGFDPAGNLNHRTNNALIQSFAVNSDNELTTATNGGTLTVVGTTTSGNRRTKGRTHRGRATQTAAMEGTGLAPIEQRG